MADLTAGTPPAGDVYGMYPILDWQTYPYGGGAGTTGNPYKINTTVDWMYAYGNIDGRSESVYFKIELKNDYELGTEFMILKKPGSGGGYRSRYNN